MEHSNEPLDPLPEVLPDVDLPCACGTTDGKCLNGGRKCSNYRGAKLMEIRGSLFYQPTERHSPPSHPLRVPWNLVRAALAQPAEGDGGIETWVIDWATTRIQPARAREDAAATPSGGALADSTQPGEPERIDPYKQHRLSQEALGLTDAKIAALTAEVARFGVRIEARRDVPMGTPAWPSDPDCEELYVS